MMASLLVIMILDQGSLEMVLAMELRYFLAYFERNL